MTWRVFVKTLTSNEGFHRKDCPRQLFGFEALPGFPCPYFGGTLLRKHIVPGRFAVAPNKEFQVVYFLLSKMVAHHGELLTVIGRFRVSRSFLSFSSLQQATSSSDGFSHCRCESVSVLCALLHVSLLLVASSKARSP